MIAEGKFENGDDILIARLLKGRIIKSCRIDDEMDSYFIIEFEDGVVFSIRYDWLYEWKLEEKDNV